MTKITGDAGPYANGESFDLDVEIKGGEVTEAHATKVTHTHRLRDIVGYRVVEVDRLASGRVIVEFFDGNYYANAVDVQRQIVSDAKRGNAIVDRRYSCGCWSTARNPDETGIDGEVVR